MASDPTPDSVAISHPSPPELISVPAAKFVQDLIQLFEFMGVTAKQAQFLDVMTVKVRDGLAGIPGPVRNAFIQEDTLKMMDTLVKGGVGIGSVLSRYTALLVELVFIRCIDSYLIYISEVLALIFKTQPHALKSNEHVTVKEILEHSDFNELLESITEKKVFQLSLKGMRTLAEDLAKQMGFVLFDTEEKLERSVRMVEFRNLFVHNRGIVNKIFLSRVPPPCPYRVGDKLQLGVGEVNVFVAYLMEAVSDIDRTAASKFGIPRGEETPTSTLLDLL